MAKPAVLYISYDGMLEPLGQSQVLAYLEKLAPDYAIHILSFEKKADWANGARRSAVSGRIHAAGIGWTALRYHKSPTAPATAFDITIGTIVALRIALRRRVAIVHARSYVPALIALTLKKLLGCRFLFDMRGLWADERVDGGLWPADGRLYRTAKWLERHLLVAADHIVTLTDASATEIRQFPYLANRAPRISVIPTCADLDRFSVQGPPAQSPFVLGYVGSVGTWYLFDEMLRCFLVVAGEEPGARLLIVNRNEHPAIRDRLQAIGIDPAAVQIIAADHADVAALIGRMSAAMAIITPSYSKIASAPTKLAEYLGCGVPCLGNDAVGDMAAILEGHRVGVSLPGFSDQELREGVRRLLELTREPDLQTRCRNTAVELFSLDLGVTAYHGIYGELVRASDRVAA
ncbi:MAG TPA: glycosyltransferase [Sphingomicrobium sp.]|nr:glycosyltransferase [Sphingomicrobium sp.]